MDNNALMRRLRYALALDDAAAARLIRLGGGTATVKETAAWRLPSRDEGSRACPSVVVGQLLDGLVRARRGPPPSGTRPLAQRTAVDNNAVVKALKIALDLRSDQLLEVFHAGGAKLGKHELAALLRKPGTRNYRRCGDQLLRQLLDGLAAGHRVAGS